MEYISPFMALVVVFALFNLTKQTPLEISFRKKNLGGLLLAKELIVLVLPGILIFSLGFYKDYKTFFVHEKSVTEATVIIYYSIVTFFVFFKIFSRLLNLNLIYRNAEDFSLTDFYSFKQLYSISALLIIIMTMVFMGLGLRPALLEVLLYNSELMEIRLANRHSGIPTVLMSFYKFLIYFYALIFGVIFSRLSFTQKLVSFLIILLVSGFLGAKGPIVNSIIIIALAHLSSGYNRKPLTVGVSAIGLIALSIILVYLLGYLQFSDSESGYDFFGFIINRLGLGQVAGFYEQMALKLYNPRYIINAIPFANFFFDVSYFNKDLMHYTWGAHRSATETGVMNSFFSGEAFAIAGYFGVITAPILVALNYAVAYFLLFKIFRIWFYLSSSASSVVCRILVPSFLVMTGDVNGIVFFKTTLMMIIFLTPALALKTVIRDLKWGRP